MIQEGSIVRDVKGKIKLVLMRGSWCEVKREPHGLELDPVQDQSKAWRDVRLLMQEAKL